MTSEYRDRVRDVAIGLILIIASAGIAGMGKDIPMAAEIGITPEIITAYQIIVVVGGVAVGLIQLARR